MTGVQTCALPILRLDAFVNPVFFSVTKVEETPPPGPNRPRKKKKPNENGDSNLALALPNVVPVRRNDWPLHSFDEDSALRVASSDANGVGSSDFYVNVDNKYLRILQKDSKSDPQLLEKQFTYGFVLIGLALLQDIERHPSIEGAPPRDADREIRESSRAIAPILVPMLQSLGDLADDDI